MNEASQKSGDQSIGHSHSIACTKQLVDACVAGDRCAMQQLYELCADNVYGLMVRMVGRQDADDLTQHVFLKMFRKLEQFNGQSKLETWLYRLASNEALQHLRSSKRRSTAQLVTDVTEPATDDPDRIGKAEETELLETAMSQLEPELRAILIFKEQQSLSYREIAESVGIPEGTVGSRLNRARIVLRQELAKLGWE